MSCMVWAEEWFVNTTGHCRALQHQALQWWHSSPRQSQSLWSLMPSLLFATDVGSVLVASGSNLRHGFPTHYGVPLLHLRTVFCDHVLGWAPSSKTSRRMAWRRPWSTIKTRNWCWRLVRRWVACHRNSPPSCRRLRTLNVFSSWNIHDIS